MARSTPENDGRALMRQLARMANLEEGLIKKMVLVLDCDDIPRLFVETYLDTDKCQNEELVPTKLEVSDQPVIIDCQGGIEIQGYTNFPPADRAERRAAAMNQRLGTPAPAADMALEVERILHKIGCPPRICLDNVDPVDNTTMFNQQYRTKAKPPKELD
jgi:hypothetical protein